MSAPSMLCATLEVALNRYLQLERSVLEDCAVLSGRCIALRAEDLGWTFFVEPHANGVRVQGERFEAADVMVSATTPQLFRLALRTASGDGGVPAGVQIEGEVELLAQFSALLRRVGFDPEELVAKVTGDAAAHRLVGGVKTLFGWGRQAADRLSLDTAEYLTEETGDLARSVDIGEWMDAVDTLRDGVERVEARLALLERKLAE